MCYYLPGTVYFSNISSNQLCSTNELQLFCKVWAVPEMDGFESSIKFKLNDPARDCFNTMLLLDYRTYCKHTALAIVVTLRKFKSHPLVELMARLRQLIGMKT